MAYKPGYSEDHSPYYAQGYTDGLADAPREKKLGPDLSMWWSAMYRRGFIAGLLGG